VYTLIDPPVNPFSAPEKINAWIEELRTWFSLPEFQYPDNRKRLDKAMADAQRWLEQSQGRAGTIGQRPPDRPAV
jgi:hypothetical protein